MSDGSILELSMDMEKQMGLKKTHRIFLKPIDFFPALF